MTSREIEEFSRGLTASQEVAENLTRTVETNNARIQALTNEIATYKVGFEHQVKSFNHQVNGSDALKESLQATNQKIETFSAELSSVGGYYLRSEINVQRTR